jgi:hypothetical protein
MFRLTLRSSIWLSKFQSSSRSFHSSIPHSIREMRYIPRWKTRWWHLKWRVIFSSNINNRCVEKSRLQQLSTRCHSQEAIPSKHHHSKTFRAPSLNLLLPRLKRSQSFSQVAHWSPNFSPLLRTCWPRYIMETDSLSFK